MNIKELNEKLINLMIVFSLESEDDNRIRRLSTAYSMLVNKAIYSGETHHSLADIDRIISSGENKSFFLYCVEHGFNIDINEGALMPLDKKYFETCPHNISTLLTTEQFESLLPHKEQAIWDTDKVFLPVSEWDEEYGDCLFFRLEVGEPPTVTSPISSNWDADYFTHFMRLPKELTSTVNHRAACLKSGIPTTV